MCTVRCSSVVPGLDLPDVSFSLVILRFPFHLFPMIPCLDYGWHDCAFTCRLRTHQRLLLVRWLDIDIFAIPFASLFVHYLMTPS